PLHSRPSVGSRILLAAGAPLRLQHGDRGCRGALAGGAGDGPQSAQGGSMNLPTLERLELLKLLTFVVSGLALLVIGAVAAAAPAVEAKRLGLRGLKRQRALQEIPFWATLEPFVRWLSARFGGLLSKEKREALNRKLALAGDFMGLIPEEIVGFSILTGLLGTAVGYVLGIASGLGNLVLFAGTLAGAALPNMRISSTASERMKEVS